jgi:hypothetical protein
MRPVAATPWMPKERSSRCVLHIDWLAVSVGPDPKRSCGCDAVEEGSNIGRDGSLGGANGLVRFMKLLSRSCAVVPT